MPEDMNKQVPEENLEPEEILEPEENPELKPEDFEPVCESEECPEEECQECSEECADEQSSEEECQECSEECAEIKEESVETSEEDEEPVEEVLEEEPVVTNHKKKSWWLIILLVIIVISVFNTLWNKIDAKLDNMNSQMVETTAVQTKAMEDMKANYDNLMATSEKQEVRIKKAERYITSIKNSMNDFGTEVNGIQTTATRHEEWLKKDLEAKKAELEKLSAVISELETILNGE